MGTGPSRGKSSQDGPPSDDESSSPNRSTEAGENQSVFQAGGHGKLSKDPEHEGAIRKAANEAEIIFYQTLNGNDPQLVTIPDHIRTFFPKFYGVSDKKHVILEDLTHGVKQACVMDIKMGTKTYTNDSNMLKQWMLDSKDHKTTTSVMGFRVTGFRTYRQTTSEYDVKGKPWGMALTPEDMADNLATFFDDGTRIRLDILKKYIDRLEVLLPWYAEQNIIKIYSSSLLFVYDSDGPVESATVHMIDFAHVKRIEKPDGRDARYCVGLRNLIDVFKKILDTHSQTNAQTLLPPGATTSLDVKSPRKKDKEKKDSKKRETKDADSHANNGSASSSSNANASLTSSGTLATPSNGASNDASSSAAPEPEAKPSKSRKRAGSKTSTPESNSNEASSAPEAPEKQEKPEKAERSPKLPKSPRSPRVPTPSASDEASPSPSKLEPNGDGTPVLKKSKKNKAPKEGSDSPTVVSIPVPDTNE